MESDREFMVRNLIDGQLNTLEKRLLSLCSIPSFFTYHLVTSCLPALCNAPVSEKWIHHFLSLSFISKRTTGTGDSKTEYYMIHQIIRDAISLSPQDYKTYCSILEQYFDMMCANASLSHIEMYFYEKLLCELKMGKLETWQSAYQSVMEMNRLPECDKLLTLFRTAGTEDTRDWYFYYNLLNRYINEAPAQEIISELESFLTTVKPEEHEFFCYLQLFLVVLYDSVGCWRKALSLCSKVLDTVRSGADVSQGILTAIYVNLTTVRSHLNDLAAPLDYMDSMLASIDNMNLGLQIAAYKAAGLWTQKIYQWDKTYTMYEHALLKMEHQQQRASLPLAQIYQLYHPCPVYHSDEVGIYDHLGEILLLKGNFQYALKYHQKEFQIQNLLGNKTGIAWAAYNIGKTQYLLGDITSAKNMFNESIRSFDGTVNKKNRAYPLGELSYVFQYIGQPERSFQCLEESVSILMESEDIEKCLFYFNHLGRICQAQGFLSFAAKIFELCLQYYTKNSNTDNIGWVLNNYARNFMFGGDLSNAEIYFQHAQNIFTDRFDKRGLAYVHNNIAELSVKIGKAQQAEKLFKESLHIKKEMGDQHAVCYTCREMGELYLFLNKPEAAEESLMEADELCCQGNYLMLKGDIDLSYGKLMLYRKQYEYAIECFKLATANYKKQNFLTRMINCFRLEREAAEQAGMQSLNLEMQQALTDTEQRREEEERLMMERIYPLMERIKFFIGISR